MTTDLDQGVIAVAGIAAGVRRRDSHALAGLAAIGFSEYAGGKQGGSPAGEGAQPTDAITTSALTDAAAASFRLCRIRSHTAIIAPKPHNGTGTACNRRSPHAWVTSDQRLIGITASRW